ncbi:MAG TPA: Rv2175c family DNA-binding protein [Mycobacteriales bacterium]
MAEPTWTTVPDLADRLGTDVLRVRNLIADGTLVGVRGDDGILRVPGEFVADGQVLKGLAGVLTVLRDGGYDDMAALAWLFAEDATLPGSPIQALVENRGTEVKRRAQALAW